MNPAKYHVLVLAPFTPLPEGDVRAQCMHLDPADPAAGMHNFAPILRLQTAPPADFAPRCVDDFHPQRLVEDLECFQSPRQEPAAAPSSDDTDSAVAQILSMVDLPEGPNGESGPGTGEAVDSPNGRLLHSVLADPGFRELESAWRGLALLGADADKIALSAVSVDKAHLEPILDQLAQDLAETPPDLVLLGLDLDASAADMQRMRLLGAFADQLLTTVVFGIAPTFFGITGWEQEHQLPYLPHLLHGARYATFRNLRKQDSATALIPVAGEILAREPYTPQAAPFGFADPGPPRISPAFCLGRALVQAVLETGWPEQVAELPQMASALPASRLQELQGTGITAVSARTSGRGGHVSAQALSGTDPFHRLCLSRLIAFALRLRRSLGVTRSEPLAPRIQEELDALEALFGSKRATQVQVEADDTGQDGLVVTLALDIGALPLRIALRWE